MSDVSQMRSVIVKAVVVCLAIAMAPWLSGGQEPLGMLISAFALLLGTLLVWRQPAARVLKRGPLVWGFGLLIGFALLSLLWTANRYSSAVWIVQWVMMVLAFRLSYSIAESGVGRKWLIWAYLLSAAVFSVVGIWMYLTDGYGRLTGTFYWPNPAAAYLMPAIMLAIDGLRRTRGRAQVWWMVGIVGWGAAFALADSRAATAVLALIVGLYLLISKLNRRFWILFLFSLVLAYCTSLGLVQLSTKTGPRQAVKVVPGSRLAEAVKGESSSGSDRLYYLESAFNMWFAHPLTGVGAGAYGDVHPQYQKRVISASTSAHNVYVEVLAELGLPGAMLLALGLLALLLGSLRGLISNPELVPLSLGTLGLLLHFGLDIDARYPALLCLVGAFFGLMYAQNKHVWVKSHWWWPLGSALLIVPVTSLYFSETWATRASNAQTDADYATAAEDYARATTGLVYNPDYLSAQGINDYTLASGGQGNAADLTTALKLAERAQAQDPHDGQHYQLQGRVLELKGDLAGAERAFKRALELDSYNHPDYALDLATLYYEQGRQAEALQVAGSMLAQYPPDVVSNRSADDTVAPELANLEALRGNMYLRADRVHDADASADHALTLDPGNLRGRALKHQVERVLADPSVVPVTQ